MNKVLFSARLFAVLLVTVFMSACSDDDDSAPDNEIIIGAEKFKLKGTGYAMIFNDEDENGAYYEHSILIPSPGITVSPTGGITGSGPAVWVGLRSNTTTLTPGTYKMGMNSNNALYVEVVPNFTSIGIPEEVYEAWAGEIVVSKSGNTYTLKFDFNVYVYYNGDSEEFGNDEIEGNFKGEIIVIENTPARVGKEGFGFSDYLRKKKK